MEKELKHLLRENAVVNGSRRRLAWRCASESKLAAFVDGKLEPAARKSLIGHLADCKSCLNQLAFLIQSRDWVESGEIPAALKAKARSLVSDQSRSSIGFGWVWATAVLAACLAMAFLITLAVRLRSSVIPPRQDLPLAQQSTKPIVSSSANTARNPDAVAIASPLSPAKPAGPKPEASAPLIRNATRENRSPRLLSPQDGAVINGPLPIRWEAVSDAVFYEVSIMTASGETLVNERSDVATLRLGSDVQLIAGTKYFISVRAHLRDGQIVRSKPISFRMSQ